jgi:hypothetical protein
MGQHALAVAAFDAAIMLSKEGRLLLSEALSIRARAVAGSRAASTGGSSRLHWDDHTTRQQLDGVIQRMEGPQELLGSLLVVEQRALRR